MGNGNGRPWEKPTYPIKVQHRCDSCTKILDVNLDIQLNFKIESGILVLHTYCPQCSIPLQVEVVILKGKIDVKKDEISYAG